MSYAFVSCHTRMSYADVIRVLTVTLRTIHIQYTTDDCFPPYSRYPQVSLFYRSSLYICTVVYLFTVWMTSISTGARSASRNCFPNLSMSPPSIIPGENDRRLFFFALSSATSSSTLLIASSHQHHLPSFYSLQKPNPCPPAPSPHPKFR